MMDLLSIDVVQSGGETTIVLAGEIDFGSGIALGTALDDAIESSNRVVVDLGLVTYLDSTGVRALVLAYEEAMPRGRVVMIRRPRAQVRRVLDAAGVLTLLMGGHGTHDAA